MQDSKILGRYGTIDTEHDYGPDTPNELVDIHVSLKEAMAALEVKLSSENDYQLDGLLDRDPNRVMGVGEVSIGGNCPVNIGDWIKFYMDFDASPSKDGQGTMNLIFVGRIKAMVHLEGVISFIVSDLIVLDFEHGDYLPDFAVERIIEKSS
jgi:hypothetical protein